MARPATASLPKRRHAPKAVRRQQLIRATIRSIAKNGLSDTTIATVATQAGLSQGIINLHFQSKERLLIATLQFLSDEYRSALDAALDKAGPSSAEQLKALVELDFDPRVCTRDKLAVWFAFFGESKSRPMYRKICATRDREYDEILVDLCADIAREGAYSSVDPAAVADGLTAMTNGLWLDFLLTPRELTRERGRDISLAYLAHFFPRHIDTSRLAQTHA